MSDNNLGSFEGIIVLMGWLRTGIRQKSATQLSGVFRVVKSMTAGSGSASMLISVMEQ